MEHSGARNCSLKEDMDATLNILVSKGGHVNPKDVKLHTTTERTYAKPAAFDDPIQTGISLRPRSKK
jgi:hypothetical protein